MQSPMKIFISMGDNKNQSGTKILYNHIVPSGTICTQTPAEKKQSLCAV